MPRPAKGARLWLRPARPGHAAAWLIKDGTYQRSTGFGPLALREAEQELAKHIAEKREPRKAGHRRDASEIAIADVIAAYAKEIAHSHARPDETKRRLLRVLDFFGKDTLGDLTGARQRRYTSERGSEQAARRELEDLRAALNHFFADDVLAPKINIVLPPKSPRRERFLTRPEAAKLLWTAWRKSQSVPGAKNGEVRRVAQHIARFILVGLYTGTRASAICDAAFYPTPGLGYMNTDTGIFFRRPDGERETTKRKPSVALPTNLLSHARRWKASGAHYVVEYLGKRVQRVSKGFTAVVREAGLKGVSPHTLRHSAITWAMEDGVKLWAAASYFGLTVEMLEKVYGHHHPGTHSEIIAAVRDRRAKRLEKAARETIATETPGTKNENSTKNEAEVLDKS